MLKSPIGYFDSTIHMGIRQNASMVAFFLMDECKFVR